MQNINKQPNFNIINTFVSKFFMLNKEPYLLYICVGIKKSLLL